MISKMISRCRGNSLANNAMRPSLKGFGKKRVVRVATGLLGDIPRFIPLHRVLVHEEAHQLGNGNGGMRVIQLRGPIRMKLVERLAAHHEQPDHVLKRAGYEEVLLRQAQLLPGVRFVIRIKNLGDGFRCDFLVHRPVIVADD